MQKAIKTTLSVATMLLIATLSMGTAAPAAEAHTVTTWMCKKAGERAAPPRSAAIRTYRKCLNYRAVHNLCHNVSHCGQWLQVGICETGNQRQKLTAANIASIRWRYNGSSGYDGALQFSPGTWSRTGSRYRYAYLAPPGEQMKRAERWRTMIGGNAHSSAGWPNCGRYRG